MPTPTVTVLGVFPVARTPELELAAWDAKYAGLPMAPSERNAAQIQLRAELENVYLLELLVRDRDERFEIGLISQAGSDQAPYDERYLSAEGSSIIAESDEAPSGAHLRIAFFFHYLDCAQPLQTPYGAVSLPAPTPMPERLSSLCPYEPVDS